MFFISYNDAAVQYPSFFGKCRKIADLSSKYKNIISYIKSKNKDGELVEKKPKCKLCDCYFDKEYLDSKNIVINLPSLITLNNNEKFKNEKGEIIEVEVRGEREVNKIFFKLNDVGKAFEFKSLYNNVLINKNTTFTENEDYKSWAVQEQRLFLNCPQLSKQNSEYVYLTFPGLTKIINTSKKPAAKAYKKWADEKLFIIKYGTIEQKEELIEEIEHGICIDEYKKSLNIDECDNCGIYMIILGYWKHIKISMEIINFCDKKKYNNFYVVKIGRSDNIKRRFKDHIRGYEEHIKTEAKLYYNVSVDEKDCPKAEKDIHSFGVDDNIPHEIYEELFLISEINLKKYSKKLKEIGNKYKITINNTKEKLLEMENKLLKVENNSKDLIIKNQKLKNELKDKDIELRNKEIENLKLKYENNLKDKEIENLKLKMEIMMLKNSK